MVRGPHGGPEFHIGQDAVCWRSRSHRSMDGSNGTPSPAQTSWACNASSKAALGSKVLPAPDFELWATPNNGPDFGSRTLNHGRQDA
jgi:hypothetical protein